MIRVLGEAVWQRDTLEHHVASLTNQLREKTDLLSEAEMARVRSVEFITLLFYTLSISHQLQKGCDQSYLAILSFHNFVYSAYWLLSFTLVAPLVPL